MGSNLGPAPFPYTTLPDRKKEEDGSGIERCWLFHLYPFCVCVAGSGVKEKKYFCQVRCRDTFKMAKVNSFKKTFLFKERTYVSECRVSLDPVMVQGKFYGKGYLPSVTTASKRIQKEG